MPKQAKVPAVRFNLKSAKPDNVESLIILIYRYGENRLVYSTGEKVLPKYWDKKNMRARVVRSHVEEYDELNQRLDELEKTTKDIFRENNFGEISVADFKLEIAYRSGKEERPEETSISFFQFVESFIEEVKSQPDAKYNTWKKYITTYRHLKEYADEKGINIDFDDIDFNFRNDFKNWLYAAPRNHAQNTAAKNLQILKLFLKEATRRKLNTNLSFREDGWSIPQEQKKHVVLTLDELSRLNGLDLSDNTRLQRVRDLFLIGAYSGLRFSDFTRITPEHIIQEDGVEMIEISTQKTDTEVVIPLLPELKTILEKYGYRSPKAMSNQKMNEYLKELGKLAGMDEEVVIKKSRGGVKRETTKKKWELITTHTARRSFATNFYEMGFDASALMQITGHSTEGQFKKYINIDKKRNAKRMAAKVASLMNQRHLKAVK